MQTPHSALLENIYSTQTSRVESLYQWCSINSGSTNLEGLATILDVLQQAYKPIADSIEVKNVAPLSVLDSRGEEKLQQYGSALFICKRPHLSRRILLCGHMDTVYSATHPFQKLTIINDNCVNGPGVADMKGGLLVMLHALQAFEQMPEAREMGWDVLINADEELGSPASSTLLAELAGQYKAALVYEPAMNAAGTLAKNRKGSGKLTLVAHGKAAHAGRAFAEGRNAICYLAEAVQAVHALNGKREGVTLNIGTIAGGEALNVVPDKAAAQLDIRISKPQDEVWVRHALEDIIAHLSRPHYSLHLHGHFGRPVKRVNQATQKLFKRVQKIGELLGLSIDWQDSGGCCDGNNLAQFGLPVLDTLGVRGGNIHSTEEYILLDSLTERAALSALLLMDLAQGGLEDLTHDAISQGT